MTEEVLGRVHSCPPCLTLHLLPNDHSVSPAHHQRLGPTEGQYPRPAPPQALHKAPVPQWPAPPNFCFPASPRCPPLTIIQEDLLLSPPILVSLIWTFTSSVPPTVVQGPIPALILPVFSMSLLGSVSPRLAGALSLLNLLSFYSLI